MPSIITAGGAADPGIVQTGGNDGALTIQTGPAGAKVNAIALAADGTPTLVKGPTIGTAPTPVPSGSAPVYGARAWCVFDGNAVGTNAPTAGGNISTVTRNSTGNYTLNFTTAMPDANFAFSGNTGSTSNLAVTGSTKTASAFTLIVRDIAGAASDTSSVNVAIFR